jgi:hypothetical protein
VHASASDCKGVGDFLAAILWKPFQLFRRILNDAIASQKRRPFCAYFGGGKKAKIAAARAGGGGWGCSSVFTLFFAEKSITKSERFTGALS